MRVLLAFSLALAWACAGTSSSTRQTTTPSASSQQCDGVSALAYRGTDVYPGPDSTLPPIATLKQDTRVCVSNDSSGFGFRRVKLANGSTGYIAESSLAI
jgi:hypothetical protein